MPSNRFLELEPKHLFGEEAILTHLLGVEEISGDYQFTLTIYSPNDKIKPEDVIGRPLKIRMDRGEMEPRYFHGYINAFSACDSVSTTLKTKVYRVYRVQIVSWLWFMTCSSRCHVYLPEKETKTIRQVLDALIDLVKQYKHITPEFKYAQTPVLFSTQVEHCVQYRETDFAFFSRLLERYGARYHFDSRPESLVVVVSDDFNYPKAQEFEVAYSSSTDNRASYGTVTSWEHDFEFVVGKVELNDFNFTIPSCSLASRAKQHSSIKLKQNGEYSFREYPGFYDLGEIGHRMAQYRQEEEESRYDRVSGTSTCKTFMAGFMFKLTDHPTCPDEKGKSYLLTTVKHEASQPGPFTSEGVSSSYSNSFECCSTERVFRQKKKTPQPTVAGVQTAKVCGKAGEEIWTDRYGRVKVQFHWDQIGLYNEYSSCWVRVSQSHAGKGFGGIDIPRVGEEVIVSFVEGDIDRPLITGRVYNGERAPPFDLPTSDSISGYVSRTVNGLGYNEFTMNDKRGAELITLHAQKDMKTTIEENDETLVKHNRVTTIKQDETLTVSGNRNKSVEKDETCKVKGSRKITIEKELTTSVIGAVELSSQQSSITLEAGAEIILKAGAASITLKKDGTIEIAGKDITLHGSNDLKLDAINITSNAHTKNEIKGTSISASAVGICELSGALIKLN